MSRTNLSAANLFRCLAVAVAVVTSPLIQADEQPSLLDHQRARFSEARAALNAGNLGRFEKLSAELEGYALYPYLRYWWLQRNLGRVDPAEIRAFLQVHEGTPLEGRLRSAWLARLARKGAWTDYLKDYRDVGSTELACHYVHAKLRSDQREEVWEEIERLWLVGQSQPDACDPAFKAWREAGRMSRSAVIARIGLAMEANQLGLASYLARFLPEEERPWVRRWQAVHRAPEAELKRLKGDTPEWSARLFSYGVGRLAGLSPSAAEQILRSRGDAFDLAEGERVVNATAIAISAALRREPQAGALLGKLAASTAERGVHEWRLRMALWEQDWPAVLEAVDGFGGEDSEWLYWRARALEALGREEEAQVVYARASDCRCYYGFLAAERIGTLAVTTRPLTIEDAALRELAARPAFVRARELHRLGMATDARREWRDATADLTEGELQVAAKLADSWGWHYQAILTLGRTDTLDDLELRFPMPFRAVVSSASSDRELDMAYVYAVMRQESAFWVDARSPVGALGLMQLMPSTARNTAKRISLAADGVSDILDVENNVSLGTAYLRSLLDQYEGNWVFTLAAYNAGPHRVRRWRPEERVLPADVWIANIPFRETRNYVQRTLAYRLIYDWRLGRELTPLSAYLEDIGPVAPVRQASEEEGQRGAESVTEQSG